MPIDSRRAEALIAEDRARIIVSMLMARDGLDHGEIARALGIARSNVSMRLSGQVKFTIGDLHLLTDLFHVSPGVFFRDPAKLFQDELAATGGSSSAWNRRAAGRHLVAA